MGDGRWAMAGYLSRMTTRVTRVTRVTRARVEGMSCQHCVRAVFTALAAVDGIARAHVAIGWIEVEHDGRVTIDQLREAVAVAGYDVRDETVKRVMPILESR
jgi:copper chaperone CopZ